MLLCASVAMTLFLFSGYRNNQLVYGMVFLFAVGNIYFSYSRGAIAALFLMMFFLAYVMRYYKLIYVTIFSILLFAIYIFQFAPDDTKHFVEDTITFQNPSSVGHLVDWLQGVESMATNPLGLGLATSGNAGGVEGDLKVGGENQYIIYGVQLGVLGMLLYILVMAYAITYSVKAFKRAASAKEKVVPLVAATTKFGLLLPLFTSNVEIYLFVSLISWWLVGQSVRIYTRNGLKAPKISYGLSQ